jgi:hypothetical protein
MDPWTLKKISCLSLVQLCTLLNYNTEDQITTHSPSAYTQGSMKIKYQCSKSIKRQDLLFNSKSLQQSSTVIKCNAVRLLSHKHANIYKHYFIWQLASLHHLSFSRDGSQHTARRFSNFLPQLWWLSPTVQLAPSAVWTSCRTEESLTPARNWTPDRPPHSKVTVPMSNSSHFLYPCQNNYASCLTGVWTWPCITGRPEIVSENGVLRIIFGHKRDEVRGDESRLHGEKLLVFCSSAKSTGLLKMNVRVLTTCRTQYTWDSSM